MEYSMRSSELAEIVRPVYKYQRFYLLAMGVWKLDAAKTTPLKKFLYEVNYYHIFVFWIVFYVGSMFVELIRSFGSLEAIIDVFIILATDIAMSAKFRSLRANGTLIKKLVDQLTLPIFIPKNKDEERILRRSVKLARRVSSAYSLSCMSALVTFVFRPILVGSYKIPFAAYFPFDLTDMTTYLLIYVYQAVGITLQCGLNVVSDTLAGSFQIYAGGQIDILRYRLENIATSHRHNKDLLGGKSGDEKVERALKDCIAHHKKIMEFIRTLEEIINVPYTVQMISSAIVICVNLYMLSFMSPLADLANFITFICYQVCMMAQIFIVCYFGNEINYKSSQLGLALYSSSWFNWSKRNKKTLMIMMERFKVPIKMTALNLYAFDLRTFSAILNSAYSYFAILRNING